MPTNPHRPLPENTPLLPDPRAFPQHPNFFFPAPAPPADSPAPSSAPHINIPRLLARYWLLAVALLILGAAGGFTSVILQAPLYRASTMIEIQGFSESFLKNFGGDSGSSASSDITIQTQIRLIQSSSFLRNVINRLNSETVPPLPPRSDLFSRLRSRIRPDSQDPMTIMRDGLMHAQATYQVRPINGTRLIEIYCESTHPEIAANFVNTLAAEYVEQSNQSRSQSTQKAANWLTAMLEEAKIRYQEAEGKLNEFMQKSGTTFVGDEAPLSDIKLRQLKTELAAVQSERIARQSQYEIIRNTPPENLTGVLGDDIIRAQQAELATLKQQLVRLQSTFTPNHYKVQAAEAQIAQLQNAVNGGVAGIAQKIRNDYEAALRKERLLSGAYVSQSRQVISEAGKGAEFNALKREVDIAKQAHTALLLQVNQVNNASSATMNNLRVVDPSQPSPFPYKPRPTLNISFGLMLGLAAAVGIAFLRESLDHSVKTPGQVKPFLRVPELGVIPSSDLHDSAQAPRWRLPGLARPSPLFLPEAGTAFEAFAAADGPKELAAWRNQSSIVTESFRSALASLLRGEHATGRARVIMVSSPGAGEGKTTIVTNLGIALAESGRRVLLIDADFRRSRLHQIFNIRSTVSFGELLASSVEPGTYPLDHMTVPTTMPGLFVLPNIGTPANIQRLLYSSRLPAFLDALRPHFDVILIDAPPALQFADARILGRLAEGTILVLRAGVTAQQTALQAFQRFADDGTPLIGTILNDWTPPRSETDRYYKYYQRSTAENA